MAAVERAPQDHPPGCTSSPVPRSATPCSRGPCRRWSSKSDRAAARRRDWSSASRACPAGTRRGGTRRSLSRAWRRPSSACSRATRPTRRVARACSCSSAPSPAKRESYVTCPELGLSDTAKFTVLPGQASRVVVRTRDTTVFAGVSYTIDAYASDNYGNRRSDAVSYTASVNVASVNSTGRVTVGSAIGRGSVAVQRGQRASTRRDSPCSPRELWRSSMAVPAGPIEERHRSGGEHGESCRVGVRATATLPRRSPCLVTLRRVHRCDVYPGHAASLRRLP